MFNPSYGRRYLLRNHQKLIVIADDRVAIIGGANIDDDLSDGPRRRALARPVAADRRPRGARSPAAISTCLFRWSKRKDSKLRSLRRMVGEYSEWRGPLQWKFSGPLSMRNSWWRSIGRDIKRGHAARHDLRLFRAARRDAPADRPGRRGAAQARIITAAKSDNNATIAAARHSYSRLLRRHVEHLRISAGQAPHQARDRRRRRPHRLVELRLPQPLHQPRDDAADQGRGLCRRDARLFRARARRLPMDHAGAAQAAGEPVAAAQMGAVATSW